VRPLRLGTRGSQLALTQSRTVAARLEALGAAVELVPIVTAGDVRAKDTPIGDGVFVKAIESALIAGEIDLAVHSAKDMPLAANPALEIAALPERADPRDALVTSSGATLETLPHGATVGTDSPRRAGFLHALRTDLLIVPLHGNVDTRLRRLDEGQADALLLACAGLDRLGYGARIAQRIAADVIPPAPGQGALAVQTRRDDARVVDVVRRLDDPFVRRAVVAERALLRAVGGGCRAPTGALATSTATGGISLLAGTASLTDGARHVVLVEARDVQPSSLAAAALTAAAELLRTVAQRSRALLDPRPQPDPALAQALTLHGFRVVSAPTFRIEPIDGATDIDRARESLDGYDWVVLTSRRGVSALLDANPAALGARTRWAVVGAATAEALREHGVVASALPSAEGGRNIPAAMAAIAELRGTKVLLARADGADPLLAVELRRLGAVVDDVVAYRTVEGPRDLGPAVHAALDDPEVEAVAFASGSGVRGLVALAGTRVDRARRLFAFTAGPQTSAVAREQGFVVAAESESARPVAMAAAIGAWYDERVLEWVTSELRCA
jgi:hydroxymethylbilane synthase